MYKASFFGAAIILVVTAMVACSSVTASATAIPDPALDAPLATVKGLSETKMFQRPIVTQVAPLQSFNEAEAYHPNYLVNHPDEPYIVINDLPKIENLRKQLPRLYRAH